MDITRKAYAKINLGLNVTGIRDDGYHLVRMIMQTVDLYDVLSFRNRDDGQINLTVSTSKIPATDDNLVVKVAKQLQETFNVTKGADITLEKNIPVAAGMAGGSTDAAAAYKALNELWGLGLSIDELCCLAVELGADIPYCLIGGTCTADGIGEVITKIPELPDCHIIIAKPNIDVSTGWVYKTLDSRQIEHHPDIDAIRMAIEMGDLKAMCSEMGNVLEIVTKEKYDVITEIENICMDCGAIGSMMSGSGPTVFAIYDNENICKMAYEQLEASGLVPQLFMTHPITPKD